MRGIQRELSYFYRLGLAVLLTIIFTATSSRYLSKSLFLDKIILEEYFFLEALDGPSHPGQL